MQENKEIEDAIVEGPTKEKTEFEKVKEYIYSLKTYNELISFELKLPLIKYNLTDKELEEINGLLRIFMFDNLKVFSVKNLQYGMEKILNDIVNEYRKERAKVARALSFKKTKFETARNRFKK